MTWKILGTTVLAATGVCGTAAVWSHARQGQSREHGDFAQRSHSRRGQFSHRDRGDFGGESRGDSSSARDFMPRRMQGAGTWDDRGR